MRIIERAEYTSHDFPLIAMLDSGNHNSDELLLHSGGPISDLSKLKNNIGLQYDRLKWRRRRGRLEPSLEILFQTPKDPIKLVRPEIWWKERIILTRSLIYKKKYPTAYKVSIERENFKAIQVSDLNKLTPEKVFEKLTISLN